MGHPEFHFLTGDPAVPQFGWSYYNSGWRRNLVHSPDPVRSGFPELVSPPVPWPPGNDSLETLFPLSFFAAIPPSLHSVDVKQGYCGGGPLVDKKKKNIEEKNRIM